jgi:hypothetical protein
VVEAAQEPAMERPKTCAATTGPSLSPPACRAG